MSVNPEIYMIRVPFKRSEDSATNCYLIKHKGEALLVDTGAPTKDGNEILVGALDALGVDRSRLRYFITHMHPDHVGLLKQVAVPRSTVYMSKASYVFCRSLQSGDGARLLFESLEREGVEGAEIQEFQNMYQQAASREVIALDPFKINLVGDGDRISVGGCELEVIETPGHAIGHACLNLLGQRILFSGDHVLYHISPSIELFSDGRDGVECYLQSLEKVRRLNCSRLLAGHGAERTDFLDRIDWLEAHHKERLDEIVSILKATPFLTGNQIVRAVHWNVPFESWESISVSQRAAIVREGIALIENLVHKGLVFRIRAESGLNVYSCDKKTIRKQLN